MSGVAAIAFAAIMALCAAVPTPAFATPPVRGVVIKPLNAAPGGANAVRLSIYGDKSNAQVQVRLLAPGQDGVLTGYFVSPTVTVDFTGWKTVVMPFSDFKFKSEMNPEATRDGMGSMEALGQSAMAQIAVTAVNAKIYLADMGWTTAEASPTDAPLAPIDLSTKAADLRVKEGGANLKMRALTMGFNTEPAYNKDGQTSLRIIVRNPALDEKSKNTAAISARLKTQPTLPYTLYTRPIFEPVEEDSTPTLAEAKAGVSLSITACQDEVEPASFAAYSIKDIASATVRVGNLSGGGGRTLPASAINVHVVKTAPVYNGPRLLVKDDRVALSGMEAEIPLTGNPQTSLKAGESKLFWVTVQVPRNQTPGTYKGVLTFSGQGIKATNIPLTVDVQNLPLKASALLYAMELRSLLSAGEQVPGATVTTPALLASQLVNIRDHGFTITLLNETGADLEAQMKAYQTAELRPSGLVMVGQVPSGDISQVESVRQSLSTPAKPFTVYYYLSPSLLASGVAEYAQAVTAASQGALVAAPIESAETYDSLTAAMGDKGSRLAPVYNVSSDYAQKVLKSRKRTTSNKDFWTWSVANQDAVKNRLLAGYITFSTGTTLPGFYGVLLGPFQNVPEGTDPYAIFAAGAASNPDIPRSITYPVKGGTLNTVQWEAVREGIDDTRYIGVLKTYIRQIKDNDALRTRFKAKTDAAEALIAAQLDKVSADYSPEQVQNYRNLVIKQSVALRSLLSGK